MANARPRRLRRPGPGTRPRVAAVSASESAERAEARPSAPSRRPVSANHSASPRAARRDVSAASPSSDAARGVPEHRALVCRAPTALAFDDYDATAMFDTLGKVAAVPVEHAASAVACRSIAEARGYDPDELYGLAEVGYHYFRSGGLRLAEVIFEGLTAIAPDEAYFWLALGLVEDYLDDKTEARRCYETAARLDPDDPRPEINLAELDLERRDRRSAQSRLRRGLVKAVRARDDALERKAQALMELSGLAA